MTSTRTYREQGYGWAVWKFVARLPGSVIVSRSYRSRLDADAASRHLSPAFGRP